MQGENKKFVDRIWDSLASVKLAIVLFALIAITSIAGTILEQGAAPEINVKIIGSFVGYSLAPGVYGVLDAMGFMDMYHSWWFISLLALFSSNLLICSLDRFPKIWRMVRMPQKPLGDGQFGSMRIRKELSLKGSPDSNADRIVAALNSLGFKPREHVEAGNRQFYAQKGNFSRLGVYITHLSMLVILVGAVVGIFFGFKGFLNVPEGSTYPVAFGRKPLSSSQSMERSVILNAVLSSRGDVSAASAKLGVEEPRLLTRMRAVGIEPLGFSVKCEDFDVKFYGRSDMPKEYTSHLVVVENGRAVADKWIEVNSPLKYGGYTFYQSSYGMMSDPNEYRFIFRVSSPASPGGNFEEVKVKMDEPFSIPGTVIEATVSEFSPALAFDQEGRPFTYEDMMNNPAARVVFRDGTEQYSRWILKRHPLTWAVKEGLSVELVDIWGSQFTGLQVRRDPGVWLVYLGCLIMSIGLYIAFFTSHRRVWVKLSGSGGSTTVTLAASAHKNREAFERKIERTMSLLREGGK